jgi:hypothetical protein
MTQNGEPVRLDLDMFQSIPYETTLGPLLAYLSLQNNRGCRGLATKEDFGKKEALHNHATCLRQVYNFANEDVSLLLFPIHALLILLLTIRISVLKGWLLWRK